MRFPNAYIGVKRLFTTEILIGFFIALTVFFPLGFQSQGSYGILNGLFTGFILVMGAVAVVTRVLALGHVAIDEETYIPGQRSTFFAFLFFLNNLILLPLLVSWLVSHEQDKGLLYKEILITGRTWLPVVLQTATLYYFLSATLIIILGTENIATRLRDGIVIDLGVKLKWMLTGLFFTVLLTSSLNAVLPEEVSASLWFRIPVGVVLLAYLIVAGVYFLHYLRMAEDMLLQANSKEEFIWTGVAQELLPDNYQQDVTVEEPVPDFDVHYWPVEALNAPSKWARDAELLLKGELHLAELEAEEEPTTTLSQCARRLFFAEAICVFNFLFAFLLAQNKGGYIPLFPGVCSLLGKLACLLQWNALCHVSIEQHPRFRSSKKMLVCAFWIACCIFITPFLIYAFRFEYFSFIYSTSTLFDVFFPYLRFLWIVIPVHVTPCILSCLGYLADLNENMDENMDEARCWKKLSFWARPAFYMLCAAALLQSVLFTLLVCLYSTVVWFFLLRNLFQAHKKAL